MWALRGGILLAVVILAGCREERPAVRVPPGAVEVSQVDYRFRPQRLATEAGRVTLTVTNRGRLAHTLRLRKGGREWLRTSAQLPGETTTVTERLEPGSYRMFCAIGNHEELGMWGTLVVR